VSLAYSRTVLRVWAGIFDSQTAWSYVHMFFCHVHKYRTSVGPLEMWSQQAPAIQQHCPAHRTAQLHEGEAQSLGQGHARPRSHNTASETGARC
jgi:hypothetical protein